MIVVAGQCFYQNPYTLSRVATNQCLRRGPIEADGFCSARPRANLSLTPGVSLPLSRPIPHSSCVTHTHSPALPIYTHTLTHTHTHTHTHSPALPIYTHTL